MPQTTRWLWGLAPLALLWAAGNLVMADRIEQDLARRAVSAASAVAGTAPGAKPIVARIIGRDIVISGEALSADGASRAMAQLRSEFGVRRALGGLSQVVAQKPYSWSATREAQAVVLNGFVPDEATATANVAAATAALPGIRVEDRQSLAFGAPDGFAELTRALLAELPRLQSGKLALDDGKFCIEGQATTPDAFLALESASSAMARRGFQPVDCTLQPPMLTPYRFAITHDAGGAVALSGFYPDPATRDRIVELARAAFPRATGFTAELKPALGEPSAFPAKVARAISDLQRLRNGKAELLGDAYVLSGQGPEDYESCQALRLLIAQMDGPDSVAQATIACPAAPPPLPPMPPLPEIPALILPEAVAPSPAPAQTTADLVPAPSLPAPPPAEIAVLPPVLPDPPPPPAPPVPLRWRAEKSETGLALSGLAPSDAAREAVLAAAAASAGPDAAPASTLETRENLAETPDYGEATRFALSLLAPMRQGTVSIEAGELTLSGTVPDLPALNRVQALLAGPRPQGLSLKLAPDALTVRPYQLKISTDKSGLNLQGYLPDEPARTDLKAVVGATPERGRLDDQTALVPSAPPGFAAATRLATENLMRLDLGSASVSEKGVTLRGLTCRELIKSEVETSAATARAAGVPVDAAIGLRQTGCVLDPPNTCQRELDDLTRENKVLFGQGTTVVRLDAVTERVIEAAHAILEKCPQSRITIEGHANRDGEAHGFDNLDLSMRRALRVRDELVKRGVEASQLAVQGFGAKRPLVPYGQPEARAMNRRVQFTVAK